MLESKLELILIIYVLEYYKTDTIVHIMISALFTVFIFAKIKKNDKNKTNNKHQWSLAFLNIFKMRKEKKMQQFDGTIA